jgi:PIN domain nuclease of toxin-antitoxin system
MRLLIDTHLLLWAAGEPEKLSGIALEYLQDSNNRLVFSAASLWEVVIKHAVGRADFQVEPPLLRRGLLDNGWEELHIDSRHTLAVSDLKPIHKDPFDRMLVAQANVEGIELLTADAKVAAYDGPIVLV